MREAIDRGMLRTREPLRARLKQLEESARGGRNISAEVDKLAAEAQRSAEQAEQRRARLPRVTLPEELPISAKRGEIASAIRAHQVVIVCGETGSGKTTQLPKICLELGRGVQGMIGHTQPRRIAARSVAARIAAELRTTLGDTVGYQVRFTDKTSSENFVKVMTDGILLAETQGDRWLAQYDTLIIDEAHERSLNIDFLLGYVKQLLPRRPELKLIITSATIDAERFSEAFRRCAGHRGVRTAVPGGRVVPPVRRGRRGRARDRPAARRSSMQWTRSRAVTSRRCAGVPAGRAGDPRGGRGAAQASSAGHGDPAAVRAVVGGGAGADLLRPEAARAASCLPPTWRRPRSPCPVSAS